MALKGTIQSVSRIMKVVRQKSASAVEATLANTVDKLIADIDKYWSLKYKGVTGNAYTSVTAGVYYKGKLVHVANSGEGKDKPTRISLRKGQKYNLPSYYDGDSVVEKPFIGSEGYLQGYGPKLGKGYVESNHPAKRSTWAVLIVMPMPYAEYHPGLVRTMQAIKDALPLEVNRNIVYVQNAPMQSVIDYSEVPF